MPQFGCATAAHNPDPHDQLRAKHGVPDHAVIAANHRWAGEYGRAHNGLDFNADGTYELAFVMCGPEPLSVERGVVLDQKDGTLRLWREAGDLDPQGIRTLVPVAWGKRRYLFPVGSDWQIFSNGIALGFEQAHGQFSMMYIRRGDATHAVSGMPTLPGTFNLPDPDFSHYQQNEDASAARDTGPV